MITTWCNAKNIKTLTNYLLMPDFDYFKFL